MFKRILVQCLNAFLFLLRFLVGAFYVGLMILYRLSQLGIFFFECLVFFFERLIFRMSITQLSVPKLDLRAERLYRRYDTEGRPEIRE